MVQTTAFVLQGRHFSGFKPVFFRLVDGQEAEKEAALRGNQNRFDATVQDDFKKIPGSPIVFWVSKRVRDIFGEFPSFDSLAKPRQGMASTNNELFVRAWHEISIAKTKFDAISAVDAKLSQKKWFPYDKGGEFRRWFGNNEFLINFHNDGQEVCHYIDNTPGAKVGSNGRVINRDKYFQEGITWSAISSGSISVRYTDCGHIFSNGGSKSFNDNGDYLLMDLGFLNSKVADYLLNCISQTVNLNQGVIAALPLNRVEDVSGLVRQLILIFRLDWNSRETSWGFDDFPLIRYRQVDRLAESWRNWQSSCLESMLKSKQLEEDNNRAIINAYGLQDELSPEVPEDQITLTRADREKDCQRLISYAIGCMMGRYSLDAPGLIYAHAGNVGFDPSRYPSFPADADGILPVSDQPWFADDAAARVREFLHAVWGPDTLEENLAWLAESLGPKGSETPDETIRRYIANQFFKDHLQTYKKRPIYWLFSSGKQGAFQALVYLHRYHEGTLARLRSEYVIPLTAKYAARLDLLAQDATAATSAAARTKINKQIETLRKQQAELLAFDEKLRHYADMRITLDLDDGVKVNYGKFGDLLAGVKIVTGGSADD